MHAEPRTTTTLHEVRDFLVEQGQPAPPWSSGRAAVDALFGLLREHRDDDGFWVALEALLERLEDQRVRPELIEGAEVLDGATVGRLLAELRAALPEGEADVRGWLGACNSARVLAALLLLGTAVGCQPQLDRADDDDVAWPDDDDVAVDDDDVALDDDDSDDGLCEEAEQQNLVGEEGEVYCELVELVRSSDAPTGVQMDVLDCLPELSATYREYLLELFSGYSDAELAEALQELAWSDLCDDEWEDDDDVDH